MRYNVRHLGEQQHRIPLGLFQVIDERGGFHLWYQPVFGWREWATTIAAVQAKHQSVQREENRILDNVLGTCWRLQNAFNIFSQLNIIIF